MCDGRRGGRPGRGEGWGAPASVHRKIGAKFHSFESHNFVTNNIVDLDPHSGNFGVWLHDGLQYMSLSFIFYAPASGKYLFVRPF